MSGISLFTVLEIYANSDDLMFMISEDKETHTFGFIVSRGPGHDYKIMLTAPPFADSLDAVLENVKVLLETVMQAGKSETDENSEHEMSVLTDLHVSAILEKLRSNREVSTF